MKLLTVAQVSALASVKPRTLDYWAQAGVATPAVALGRGRAMGKQYTFTELVGVRAVARLRAQGVSLQAVRKILPLLRELTGATGTLESLAGARLMALDDDVVLARSAEQLVSLLVTPRQALMAPVLLDVGDTARELQAGMEQAAATDTRLADVVESMKREGAWIKAVA